METDFHQGGCACGIVRYKTISNPVAAFVCNCRYCQLRTGSAFGIGVYFLHNQVHKLSGNLKKYSFNSESGNKIVTQFCIDCGTSIYLNFFNKPMSGWTGITGGTFDPPSFWYDITREVYTRSSANFVNNKIKEKLETSTLYNPLHLDEKRKQG